MNSCAELLTSQHLVPWIQYAVVGTLEDLLDHPPKCATNKTALGIDLGKMNILSFGDAVTNLDVIEVRVVQLLDELSPPEAAAETATACA